MKRLVYISHPSGGLKENDLKIADIMEHLLKDKWVFDNFCVVSPVHCYGYLYDKVDYDVGLQFCIDLLDHCELMLVFGDWKASTGCNREIQYCQQKGIPYIIISDYEEIKDNIGYRLRELIK